MKIIYNLMLILSIYAVSSCSSIEYPAIESSNQPNEDMTLDFNMTIKYNGVAYDVPCSIVNDSLIYLDEVFNEVYMNCIKDNSNLAELVYKDEKGEDVIEYYSSIEELEEINGIKYFNVEAVEETNFSGSRFVNVLEPKAGRAILYDDTNYKDRKLIIDIDYNEYISIPKLSDTDNFNDKTSAIRVFNFLEPNTYYKPSYLSDTYKMKGSELRTCLIGFENSNYNNARKEGENGNGKVLYCIAEYNASQNLNDATTASHQDYKLKNIGWNDKLSSLRFRIITVQNVSSGIYTPHKEL